MKWFRKAATEILYHLSGQYERDNMSRAEEIVRERGEKSYHELIRDLDDTLEQSEESQKAEWQDGWAPSDALEYIAKSCEEILDHEDDADTTYPLQNKKRRARVVQIVEAAVQYDDESYVSWYDYYTICKVFPELSDLWRQYPENFDLEDAEELTDMAQIMPDHFKNQPHLSVSGDVYISPFIPAIEGFAIAEQDAEHGRRILVQAFQGNENEVLDDMRSISGNEEAVGALVLFYIAADKALQKSDATEPEQKTQEAVRLDPPI